MRNYKIVYVLFVLIILHLLTGCDSKEMSFSKLESRQIDSLIAIHEVNSRTVILKFGFDGITAIRTNEGIVVVDAGISTFLTSKYKSIIEKRFNTKNFIYVFDSHGHSDHIRGNCVFKNAQIAGHENCRMDAGQEESNSESSLMKIRKIVNDYDQQLQNSIPDTPEWNNSFTQKIRYLGASRDVEKHVPYKYPDITFSDSLKLGTGDITFEMMYFGKFHSNSDILIYSPEIRTLFTGDLFSKYGRPSKSSSSVMDEDRRMTAIKWINRRINNIETIIDGHGEILSIDALMRFKSLPL